MLAVLVPVLRRFGSEAVSAVARQFNQVAWAAFGVLILTGIWNVAAASAKVSHDASYRTTLIVKLAVVLVSGVTAALHIRAGTARSRAILGGLTGTQRAGRAVPRRAPGRLTAAPGRTGLRRTIWAARGSAERRRVIVFDDLFPAEWVGRRAIVSFPGRVDISNAGQLRDRLLAVIGRGAALLVADMSRTASCDHAAIEVVARACQRAAINGTQVRLVVTAPVVRRVLSLEGLDRLVPIYPSVEAATGPVPEAPDRQARASTARRPAPEAPGPEALALEALALEAPGPGTPGPEAPGPNAGPERGARSTGGRGLGREDHPRHLVEPLRRPRRWLAAGRVRREDRRGQPAVRGDVRLRPGGSGGPADRRPRPLRRAGRSSRLPGGLPSGRPRRGRWPNEPGSPPCAATEPRCRSRSA